GSFVESNRESQQRDLVFPDGARFPSPVAHKSRSMPADHRVRLEDAQPVPPGRPATGQPNPQQAVRLPKAETTRRALLQDGDLMAEGNDLRLLSSTGPKCRCDQSQKSDEKWSHCGNDDDLTNGPNTCIFNPDGFSVSTAAQKTKTCAQARISLS